MGSNPTRSASTRDTQISELLLGQAVDKEQPPNNEIPGGRSMSDGTLNKPRRWSISAPLALLKMSSIRAFIFAAGFSSFAAAALGAELQRSCIEPPATVIELTGINTKHARARA